jgi:uncharacterized protein (DUF2147 family)
LKLGIVAAMAAMLLPGMAMAQGGNGVVGRWLTQDRKGVIAIAPCGNSICGRIDWMNPPDDPKDGKISRDSNNPNPALRQRTICGLQIIYGFQRDGSDPHGWVEGAIYDPESGKVYHANITLVDPQHLRLRGYVGIPLFGESQIWTRADNYPRCQAG